MKYFSLAVIQKMTFLLKVIIWLSEQPECSVTSLFTTVVDVFKRRKCFQLDTISRLQTINHKIPQTLNYMYFRNKALTWQAFPFKRKLYFLIQINGYLIGSSLKETDQIFTLIHTTQQAHNVIMTSHWRRREHYSSSTSFWRHVPAGKYSTAQQAHDVEMTSYWRRCGMVASHRPHFDIITTSCAFWVSCNAVQTISIVLIYSLFWDTLKLPDNF